MVDTVKLPRPRGTASPAAPRPAAPGGDVIGCGRDSVALCLVAIASLVLGGWLLAAHHVLGYPFVEGAEDAFFNEALAGIIVLCAGYGRLQSPSHLPKLTTLQAVAGAWLLAAPWAVGYGEEVPTARINDVLCGVLAVVLALAGAWWAHLERRAAARPRQQPRGEPAGITEAAEEQPLEDPVVHETSEAGADRPVTHRRS